MLILITGAIIYALLRGYVEGMIHIRVGETMHILSFDEGVRAHKLHRNYYHKLSLSADICAAILGVLIYLYGFNLMLYVGIFFICWQCFEMSNNYARVKSVFMRITEVGHVNKLYEKINFFDIYRKKLWGKRVIFMHISRIVLGIVFLLLAK